MLDREKYMNVKGMPLKEFIKILEGYPQNAVVHVCGIDDVHIHVDAEGRYICLDTEPLEEEY